MMVLLMGFLGTKGEKNKGFHCRDNLSTRLTPFNKASTRRINSHQTHRWSNVPNAFVLHGQIT
jgi:hypothetical protein